MHNPTRLAFLGLSLLALTTTTACGDDHKSVAEAPLAPSSAVAPSISTPTSTSSSPSASPTPTGPAKLKIGDTFVGQRSKFTIRSAKLGGSAADYEPGTVWLYTDVRICNTGSDALNTPSWSMWLLKTRDDYEVKPADITPEPRQPALPYGGEVAPGDCVRGWLTFAPPKKSTMDEIRLVEDELFQETGALIASWQAK